MIPEKIMKIGVIIINLENAPTAKLVLGKGMGTWEPGIGIQGMGSCG
jgi:hypothetical protein